MPLPHDCTRLVEMVSFITEQRPEQNSGWFLDYFFRSRRTDAEKLEFRKYSKGRVRPLLYSGSCLPPNLIKSPEEAVNMLELTWPTIKAEAKITGCDVDERRIEPNGDIIPVGMQRFNNAFNWEMMGLVDSLRATHISEAITLLKTGGYVLHSSDTEDLGTIDFGRIPELTSVDLVGTDAAWSNMCSKPLDTIEQIARVMARESGVSGGIDIVHSQESWDWLKAHEERQSIKFHTEPRLSGFDVTPYLSYNDVQFVGTTNAGVYRHWVSNAVYINHLDQEVPVIEAGSVMIASRGGFDGQRVYRTITSDNKEQLPAGADFFVYDDLEEEYNRKCRSFSPWIEEYHLMVPQNVNGAAMVAVVDPALDPCVGCEECP